VIVEKITSRRSFRSRKTVIEAIFNISGRKVPAIWFNQPYILRKVKAGESYRVTGTVTRARGVLQFVNPYTEAPKGIGNTSLYGDETVVPVYPLTEGIGQHTLRRIIRAALEYRNELPDPIPSSVLQSTQLPTLADAFRMVHLPKLASEAEQGRRRFAFDEVFYTQLALGMTKALRNTTSGHPVRFHEDAVKQFVEHLPFALTTDQRRAAWDIIKDLQKLTPMQRFLNGDVGSGKTVVAAIAAHNTACEQLQTAFMAPTEILAAQHFATFTKIFANQPHTIALWTNSMKAEFVDQKITWHKTKSEQAVLHKKMTTGKTHIVIGTHALIQEKISLKNLTLSIIDEQHRFGVRARHALLGKGKNATTPHLLSMTATPIPRSLALVAYGDIDVSLLKEKPKDRLSIITKAITSKEKKSEAYEFVRKEIAKGRQAFLVCPLIEESEDLDGVTSVQQEYNRLKKTEFKKLRLAMLHGKLSSQEKSDIMEKMKRREIDVLIATSVVEVGVDIPNATVMWIESAERFGISQLHQFRGRVGRGTHQSYCYLAANKLTQTAKQRLTALENSNDGFMLAEKDLAMRGPGEILGEAQSGYGQFKIASLADLGLISQAKISAEQLLAEDPELEHHQHLKSRLETMINQTHWE
jgi:ATP-dependent DNA helicase RecG